MVLAVAAPVRLMVTPEAVAPLTVPEMLYVAPAVGVADLTVDRAPKQASEEPMATTE